MNQKGGKQNSKGPDASRYEIRSDLPDGSGFKVLGINHVFKFDQHGGWYDEFGNYYDKNNKPASHPKPTEKEEHKTATQSSHDPDPKRFENFDLLPDETGFKIKGTDHIFYFDIYGGWFDEHDNYYDPDGNPCTPPEYSEEEEEHPADRFVNEYESGSEDDNEENRTVLALYSKDQDIHVQIKNLSYKITEDDFEKFLVAKKIEWNNFEFELNHDGKFNGICYVELNHDNAEKLIDLNGHKFEGRNMNIFVQTPEVGEDEEDNKEGESDEEEHEGHEDEDQESK